MEKQACAYFAPLFDLISEKGFESYSAVEMAKDLKLTRAEFHSLFDSKCTLLSSFSLFITSQIEEEFEPSPTERESLFDILMMRFEAMKPYKKGLMRVYNETVGHATPTAPSMLPGLKKAADHMASLCASKEAPYLIHFPGEKLLYVYLMSYKVWIRDQSDDLDLTLIEIDRRLDQVNSFQDFLKPLNSFFGGPS